MRNYILLSAILFFSSTAFSQSYEGKIEYDKKKQDAFVIEYSYPAEAVENALVKKMEQLGYKGREEKGLFNKDKGFRVYNNAYVTDINSGSMDYAFKVETKGKKDQESIVYMVILSKDGVNAKSMFESRDIEKAKSFLEKLEPMVETANLELQIAKQEDELSKAEKKLKSLRNQQEDMEKRIKKLQDDLKDNVKEQDDQQKAVDSQAKALEAMKARRKDS